MIKYIYCTIIMLSLSSIGIETYYCLTGYFVGNVPDGLLSRIIFYYSYFTVLSSLALSLGCFIVLIKPDYQSTFINVLRVDGVVGIIITGLIYNIMLRSLYHPNLLILRMTAESLHVIIPILGVIGWVLFEPHRRLTKRAMYYAIIPPVIYIVYILIRGVVTGLYPYPILNINLIGSMQVLANITIITIMFLFFMVLMYIADTRWLSRYHG